jgi:hypothetical protein
MESGVIENARVVPLPRGVHLFPVTGGIVPEGRSEDNRLQPSQLKSWVVLRFRRVAHQAA